MVADFAMQAAVPAVELTLPAITANPKGVDRSAAYQILWVLPPLPATLARAKREVFWMVLLRTVADAFLPMQLYAHWHHQRTLRVNVVYLE